MTAYVGQLYVVTLSSTSHLIAVLENLIEKALITILYSIDNFVSRESWDETLLLLAKENWITKKGTHYQAIMLSHALIAGRGGGGG
jgi:hypothetical protein